ncbi:sulfatase-like hydrolase/transferase [Sinisalibacter lacisalsi]|uniref:GP-PDE domain-containing protein n=1 Tax=Sinisalibacter lacisalsi TaxID=1526570 RepID=A0ABQ1QGK1_9RHOB|nr:sulfatase-like hydrolase/transferase [Sinisalibacter lacisalsi]GGD27054.1 hypothetical protein GCM10011358_09220 [Sinisalibacter lacisalsi]
MNWLALVVSCLLVLASIGLLRGTVERRGAAALVSVLVFLSLALAGTYVVIDRITGAGIDQSVLFHLAAGFEGATVSGFGHLFVLGTALLVGALVASVLAWRLSRAPGARHPLRRGLGLAALLASFAVSPALWDVAHLLRSAVESPGGAQAPAPAEFVVPARPAFESSPKNLVVLYLESLERTYLDQELFPGLTPNLARLEGEALSFTEIEEVALASWTVSGMVASQCGVPLFGAAGNAMNKLDDFMPGATCLGDLLDKAGYRLDYLGGADLNFAGKGRFLASHGFDRIEGRAALTETLGPGEALSGWGIYDDQLYRVAKRRFDEIAAADAPFGLFLLTLDTHHPEGFPSASCADVTYGDGTNPMLNAVHCADFLAGDFIDHLRGSDAYEDTLVVIASDHLAMRNTAWNKLEEGRRRNLFMVLGDGVAAERIDRPGSSLDFGATIATLIGADTEALGFGRSLVGSAPTLAETHAPLDEFLAAQHRFLTSLWAFPDIDHGIVLDLERGTAMLEGKAVGLPALLVIGTDLSVAEILFEDAEAPLPGMVETLNEDLPFIWLDDCTRTAAVARVEAPQAGETCIAYGLPGASGIVTRRLSDGDHVSADELRDGLGAILNGQTAAQRARIAADQEVVLAAPEGLGGHYLLRSASFGNGVSRVTDLETGAGIDLVRGLTVVGLGREAGPVKLAHFDTCAWEGAVRDIDNLHRTVSETLDAFRPFYGALAVVADDSAVCGGPPDLRAHFDGTALRRWPGIDFRTPYIGILTGDGRVIEHLGAEETALAVEAQGILRSGFAQPQRHLAALPRIAHAGGAIDGETYTNSLDALEINKADYDLFEVDLIETSDGQLVCLQDWERLGAAVSWDETGTLASPMSLEAFETYATETARFQNCTLESLADWLRRTPGKRVIPDVKGDAPTALKVIAARYPDLVDRFVAQIYQPEDYPLARALGFDDVVWGLYRYGGDDADVLLWLRHMDLYGLSLPEPDARRGLALRALEQTGVLSWAHTINDPQDFRALKSLGISEVMTDGLPPDDPG